MESGPTNAVMGGNYGTELPETNIDDQALAIEKKAARFSKTKEFQALKEHLESRIAFYQSFLPSGDPVTGTAISVEERGRQWMVANAIIGEFQAVLAAYENARQVVEEATKNAI